VKLVKDSYYERSEVVRLENVSKIVRGQLYKRLCKINKEPKKDYKKPPIYQFLEILIIGICDYNYKLNEGNAL
jgi:hypothetical protein